MALFAAALLKAASDLASPSVSVLILTWQGSQMKKGFKRDVKFFQW